MIKKFLTLFGYLLSFFSVAAVTCSSNDCMIVVDSGSTGSRAHLYQYQFTKGNTPIFIKELAVTRLSPGLATLEEEQGKIDAYLNCLFARLRKSNGEVIPVYYYATAGMRLLPDEKQKKLYKSVANWFQSQSDFDLKEAKTISGYDEGVFGWLAVNYLSGTFSPTNTNQTSLGMMDFGGASMQIALAVNETTKLSAGQLTDIVVSNKRYHIFVESFLGLGVNELSHQFLDDKHCFAKQYPLPDGLRGAGDAAQCKQNIELLTNDIHHVDKLKQKSIVAGVKKWFALGALQGLTNSKPYQSLGTKFSIQEVFSLGHQGACQVDWQELKSASPKDKYLFSTCLLSAYYYAVIVNGYGVNEQALINTAIDGVNAKPDWTYGVVLTHH